MLARIRKKVAKRYPWLVPIYRSINRRYCRMKATVSSRLPRTKFLFHQFWDWRRFYFGNMDDPNSITSLRTIISKDNERDDSPSSRPRFVVVTHALSAGGAERQWCYLAKGLAAKGYTVDLLVLDLDGDNRHYLHLLAGTSVQIHSLKTFTMPADMPTLTPGLALPFPVTHLAFAFATLKPTHILCQLDSINLHSGIAALISGVPFQKLLFSFRNFNPTNFPHFYYPWMLDYYKEFCLSRRLVLSGNTKAGNDNYAEWIGIAPDSVYHTPNALVSPTKLQTNRDEVRRTLNIDRNALLIIGVFRLAPEKNPKLFVDVIARLRADFPALKVLHLGNGAAATAIKNYASMKDLGDVIHFLGNRNDSLDLIAASDLLLLCSNFEGLPNVVLEAQSIGVPVVATRAGGATAEAMLDGESGFLADIGDENALVNHAARLLGDAELRQKMGATGRDFVRRTFTMDRFCETVLSAVDVNTQN